MLLLNSFFVYSNFVVINKDYFFDFSTANIPYIDKCRLAHTKYLQKNENIFSTENKNYSYKHTFLI